MTDLYALSEMDSDLVPEILPVDSRLSISTLASVLLPLFQSAQDVAPVKEIIQYTSFTSLHVSEDRIFVVATDGERNMAVQSDVVKVRLQGHTLLPGRKVVEILKLVPEDTVRIDVVGNKATISSGRAVWSLETPPADATIPIISYENMSVHDIDRRDLLAAFEAVLPAVSRTTARQSLMQAEVDKTFITSCDGVRAHRVKLALPKTFKTTLPIRFLETAIKELRGRSEETVSLGGDHSTVVLKYGPNLFSAQRLRYDYPAVNQLMLGPALTNDEHLTMDRNDLVSTIKRVRVNADPEYAALFLSIRQIKGDWTLTVRARDKNGNASQETLKVKYDGPSTIKDIVVNHKYFLEFLDCIHEEEVTLRLGEFVKNKQSPIYYESDAFTGSLMPMMPNIVR